MEAVDPVAFDLRLLKSVLILEPWGCLQRYYKDHPVEPFFFYTGLFLYGDVSRRHDKEWSLSFFPKLIRAMCQGDIRRNPSCWIDSTTALEVVGLLEVAGGLLQSRESKEWTP